jgi:hypothetical protein
MMIMMLIPRGIVCGGSCALRRIVHVHPHPARDSFFSFPFFVSARLTSCAYKYPGINRERHTGRVGLRVEVISRGFKSYINRARNVV